MNSPPCFWSKSTPVRMRSCTNHCALVKTPASMFIRLIALAGMLCCACATAASLIAPGTYLIEGDTAPNSLPDGNSVIIVAPQGLIVFDTGRHKEHAQKLLDFAREQGRPIAAIINSHWHLDHVGGNPRLRAAFPDIRVYASSAIDAARKGFLADYRAQLVTELATSRRDPEAQVNACAIRAEMALIDAGAALGPTDVIAKSAPLTIAGHGPAAASGIARRHRRRHLGVRSRDDACFWRAIWSPCRRRSSKARARHGGVLRWRVSRRRHSTGWCPGTAHPSANRNSTAYRKAFSHLLECAAGNAGE